MAANYPALLMVGLLFNFMVMVIGGLSLLFSLFRIWVKIDRRITTMETELWQMMRAQGLQPRANREAGADARSF